MENVGMSNASLMQQVNIEAMKKAMDVQEREVLSVLQSSALQTPAQNQSAPTQAVADLTGMGQKIDIRA